MKHPVKYQVGKILLDAGFIDQRHIDDVLVEQKLTKERLGETLVRKGILKSEDLLVPLIIQEHLGSIESAVKLAVGSRQQLGALLVESGHITAEQLDQIVAEHQRSGEKIGEILKSRGILNDRQLDGLLEFQRHQESRQHSPLRIGELLVSTGRATPEQMEDALLKQKQTNKSLGDVLIEEGHVSPDAVAYAVRMQKLLTRSVLSAIITLGMASVSYAGEMCAYSQQLQNSPPMREQYIANIISAVGNFVAAADPQAIVAAGVGLALSAGTMVAYISTSDNSVVSDAPIGITAPSYSGKNKLPKSSGRDASLSDATDDDSVASLYFGKSNTPVKTQGGTTTDSFSKDCLSCHDGVVASDRTINFKNSPGRKSQLHGRGGSEHPIGMNYAAYAARDPKNYKPVAFGSKMVFVDGKVGCITCHDMLNREKGHLAKSDYRSALCLTCHTE